MCVCVCAISPLWSHLKLFAQGTLVWWLRGHRLPLFSFILKMTHKTLYHPDEKLKRKTHKKLEADAEEDTLSSLLCFLRPRCWKQRHRRNRSMFALSPAGAAGQPAVFICQLHREVWLCWGGVMIAQLNIFAGKTKYKVDFCCFCCITLKTKYSSGKVCVNKSWSSKKSSCSPCSQ